MLGIGQRPRGRRSSMQRRCPVTIGSRLAIVCALALLGSPGALLAQKHGEVEHGGEHESHRTHVALFLGATTHLHTDDTGLTLGLEYERRLSPLWGVGVLVDFASSDIERDYVIGVPVLLHPAAGASLLVAPGVEFVQINVVGEGGEEEEESETELLVRFGVAYELGIKRMSIAPQLNAEVAGGHWTLVYGLAVGIGF